MMWTSMIAALALLTVGDCRPAPAPAAAMQTPAPRFVARTAPPVATGTGLSGPKANGTQTNQTFAYTFTDKTHGFIIGCPETTSISVSKSGISAGIWCKTKGVTLSTDLAIAQTTDVFNKPNITNDYSWTHVPNAYTGPSDGCSTVTTLDTKVASTTMTYCTCGNGWMGGLALGVSGTKSTTICQAKQTAMPSGFQQVPFGPGAPKWATPVSDGPCATPTTLNQDCFKDLDIEGYAKWWWSENNKTCGSTANFADCFYGKMTPYAPSQCNALTGNADKCKQPQWDDLKSVWNAARVFYLTQTIANVNAFFSQYYTAIGDASSIANEGVGKILTTINPEKTTNLGLNSAMAALAAGLAFVPGVGGALGTGLITAAQQAPGIARFIMPSGSNVEDQMIQIGSLADSLGTITGNLQSNVTSALGEVQNDVTNFINVANNGPYSGNMPVLNDLKSDILKGLYAWVISNAYNSTGKILTRAVDTDANALSTNGSKLAWTPCGSGYYDNGTCGDGDLWYSPSKKITYGLVDTGDFTTRFDKQMAQFLDQTTGDLLFAGADDCQQNHKGSGPIISFDDGKFQTPCLSALKVCTWDMKTPDAGSDGNLMTDCDRDTVLKGYGRGSCNSQCDNVSADPYGGSIMPWAYLGWGILTDNDRYHSICRPCKDGAF